MAESDEESAVGEQPLDVDELVAQLRARVEARRRDGSYPAGLEDEMSAHFHRILHQRREPRPLPDLQTSLQAAGQVLPLQASRIPVESGLPGGEVIHRAVAKIVGRQTQGALQQVQAFAQPMYSAVEALTAAVQELHRIVHTDIAQSLDVLYDRQAAQERILARGSAADRVSRKGFQPWYSSERFEEAFRGSRDEITKRYRDLAERLSGCDPVLDVGCGRGEFLELLSAAGLEARGVDIDGELVKAAVDRGMRVEEEDAIRYLREIGDGSLGALAVIQVIEHFAAQEIVDFVALAADKVREGGQVLVETVNPQSLYVFAHALYLDPTHMRPVHPAYLAFLFREAGFRHVDIEWRSPPPSDDVLEPAPPDSPGASVHNENVRRLNELLFAPQDYLIVAVR